MTAPTSSRLAALALVAILLAACSDSTPVPSPSATVPSGSPSTDASPSLVPTAEPTPSLPSSFPLAVVTGMTNLTANVSVDDLAQLAANGRLTLPCGVRVTQPAITSDSPCRPADEIAAWLQRHQKQVALLPAGLVQPATKVLAITGDGPYGLFGADLFGDAKSRKLPYPVMGAPDADTAGLQAEWLAYDPSQVWTLTSIGSLCSDRGAAYQAVTLGKGWDWIFSGGTARYTGPPYINPNPPPGIDAQLIVNPVETGNDGLTAKITKRADVALADHKCPILPTAQWTPNLNGPPSLSVPEDVVSRWKRLLGIDAVFLAADHQSDRGNAGIQSTIDILSAHRIPHNGIGMDLDQALEPAYVEVAGITVAFVSWNEVLGPIHAAPGTPGVAWLEQANVDAAVQRARDGGADVVICDPQWWGGDEYHPDLQNSQIDAVTWMDDAGCDQILGGGLHVSGGLFLNDLDGHVRLVHAGPGNYVYGQNYRQDVQEGVILELAFRGTTMVNVRLHPYVQILNARPAMTDPVADGSYVLRRIWASSDVTYRP